MKKTRRRKGRTPGVGRVLGACLVCGVALCGMAMGGWVLVEHPADNPAKSFVLVDTPTKPSIVVEPHGGAAAPPPQQAGHSGEQPNSSDWNLLLVNPWNKLPEGFEVELITLKNGQAVHELAYPELQAMMDAARDQGLSPLICSSYRTMEKQQTLFDKQVKSLLNRGYTQAEAEEEAATWVALPGTSEHQTGLAVDIVALSNQVLDKKQAETAEQIWLMEHAHEYGFILRYPSDKEALTGIHYEPWHYRYVGRAAAAEIYEQGICLEEYLKQ